MPKAKKGKAARQTNAARARHVRKEVEENVMVDDMEEHMRADEEVVDVNQGPEEDSHAASVDSDKLSEWLDEVSGPQRTDTVPARNAGSHLRTFYTGILWCVI